MKQVNTNCFVVLIEKNRECDANSGLVNLGGRVVIDTHKDAGHVWGNPLFVGVMIIAHQSAPENLKHVAEPKESQKRLHGVGHLLTRLVIKTLHPGIVAAGQQLLEKNHCTLDNQMYTLAVVFMGCQQSI